MAYYGVLPSKLAELTNNGTEIYSHNVHTKRNLSGSENDGNQKVVFQGLDGGHSSHQIFA
jgi:hypothetical protein